MKRRYPFLAALICIPMLLLGQMDWSIDGMGVVLQSDHSNPASFNYSGWHIGFPSLAANVYHTGPAYNDLINRRDGLPILQTSRLIGNIADVNRTESNLRVQTLKIKHQGVKWSFGFEHEIRFYSQGEYPANLIKLYVEGNHQWIGEEVELAPKTTTFSYNNWAGSVSFTFGGTTIGIRPRLVTGNHLLYTPDASAKLFTDPLFYQISLKMDLVIHQLGLIQFEESSILQYQIQTLGNWNLFSSNSGFALDFGFQSRIDEKWSVGASITDWGSIHWKNILTSESRKTIRYDGARLTNLLNAEQILLIGLIDSLESLFDLQERTGQIRTKLPIQWRSNVKYQLNEKFSLFTSLYYVPVQFDPVTVAVGVSHFIGSYLMLGVSGSNRHKTLNLGFNVAVRLQKWMGFISADQVLKGLNPTKSNRYSLRAGINLHLNGTDALFN